MNATSAAAIFLLPLGAFGQTLAVGVVGGGSFTDAFRDQFFREPTPPPLIGSRFFSPSKDYLVGGMLELRFSPHWSVEGDGLFRQLHMTTAAVQADGSLSSISPSPVVTWEFPVLAKYRFQGRRWNPLVEAGPSFRTAGNLNGADPSHLGITAGFGIETHWRSLNIAPVARYTRWNQDNAVEDNPSTGRNQVELLVGVTQQAESIWRPLGRRMSVGVVLANNLTHDFRTTTQRFNAIGPGPQVQSDVDSYGPRSFIVGPAVEFQLPSQFSVEIDALHRPVTSTSEIAFSDGSRIRGNDSGVTWEFPVLAKYRLPIRRIAPFIELGPSFRLPQGELTFSSPFGVAAGTGVEFRLRQMKVAPAIRDTRWAPDRGLGGQKTTRNQVELLAGISF
jgi:hypothetical protein